MTTLVPEPPAAERAYQHTKRAIITGALAAGAMINEGSICDELGLSRTPVHEAFLRLAAERLLDLESRKGAIVRALSPSEAADVLEMREAIEGSCARRVVESGVALAVVGELRAHLADQRSAIDAGDLEAFIDADDRFHLTVVRGARNPVAEHFMSMLQDRQQRLRNQLIRVLPEQMVGSFDDHTALADAIEAEDAAGYASILAAHVDRNRGVL